MTRQARRSQELLHPTQQAQTPRNDVDSPTEPLGAIADGDSVSVLTDNTASAGTGNGAAPDARGGSGALKKAPTIRDIAHAAGVSPATVSRVLNHDATMSVSDSTRNTIITTARTMGYKKRSRRSTSSAASPLHTIGIVQPPVLEQLPPQMYYYYVCSALESRLTADGFGILRFYGEGTDTLEQALESDADGFVVISPMDPQVLLRLERSDRPVLATEMDPLFGGICTSVAPNYITSTISAIDYFLAHGQTRIGLLCSDFQYQHNDMHFDDSFLRTFRSYLSVPKLFRTGYIYRGDGSTESGYELMKRAIREHPNDLPQAFFISTDSMGVGALRAFYEAGIDVPGTVSLITYPGTPVVKQVFPELSSVTVNTDALGRTAATAIERLVSQTDDSARLSWSIKMSTTLELRGTTINTAIANIQR